MTPKIGEVWMVDMGIAGKVRPAVVVLDDGVAVERTLIVHVPLTSQNRGSVLEVSLCHLSFLKPESTANIQAIGSLPRRGSSVNWEACPPPDLDRIKEAMKVAFGL